jgi:hypothetical protein
MLQITENQDATAWYHHACHACHEIGPRIILCVDVQMYCYCFEVFTIVLPTPQNSAYVSRSA